MKVLITGASSGIGRECALRMADRGYDLVLVARSEDKLKELKKEIKTDVTIEVMDLGVLDNVLKLAKKYKGKIDILVNNAGFGNHGYFNETQLNDDVDMINLNVTAYHVLTKLFLDDFVKRDSGKILNVASIAGLMSGGPLMSTYYATKAYVRSLTLGIYEELKKRKSNVKISCLCPGPIKTDFMKRADVNFSIGTSSASFVVDYTLKKFDKNKLIIIPGFFNRCLAFFSRFVPTKMILNSAYYIQKSKMKK